MFFRALTEADTVSAGEKLGRELKKGAFIALYGDLGAGKTAAPVSFRPLSYSWRRDIFLGL